MKHCKVLKIEFDLSDDTSDDDLDKELQDRIYSYVLSKTWILTDNCKIKFIPMS